LIDDQLCIEKPALSKQVSKCIIVALKSAYTESRNVVT